MDGCQPTCVSRKDFVSDEAWNHFLKLMIYRNRQVKSSRQRNQRREKRIGNIKELVKVLRDEKALAAADYLEVHNILFFLIIFLYYISYYKKIMKLRFIHLDITKCN